jgi:hypothetical protein
MKTKTTIVAVVLACGILLVSESFAGGVPSTCELICPADAGATDEGDGQAAVEFPSPALQGDLCAGEFPEGATITCTPPSGSSFPLGDTPVSCSTDESLNGRTFPCSFTVTVSEATGGVDCDVVAPDCDEDDEDCADVVASDCDEEAPSGDR